MPERPIVLTAVASDRGRVRLDNQDACLVAETQGLFAVADGMGGRPAGAEAARMIVQMLPVLVERVLGLAPDRAVDPTGAQTQTRQALTACHLFGRAGNLDVGDGVAVRGHTEPIETDQHNQKNTRDRDSQEAGEKYPGPSHHRPLEAPPPLSKPAKETGQ